MHHESKTSGRGKHIDQNRWVFVKFWQKKILPDDLTYYHVDKLEVNFWHSEKNKQAELTIFTPSLLKGQLSMDTQSGCTLKKANQLFRQGDYAQAEKLYCQLVNNNSHILPQLLFNLKLTRKRQGLDVSNEKINQVVNKEVLSAKLVKLLEQSLISSKNFEKRNNVTVKKEGGFNAVNDDPNFLIELEKELPAGLYLLEQQINLKSKNGQYNSCIYKDYGCGLNENNILITVGKSQQKIYRVLQLEKAVKTLRFDPLDSKLSFEVKLFNIAAIPTDIAIELMKASLIEKNKKVPKHAVHDFQSLYKAHQQLYQSTKEKISYEEWIGQVELPSLPSATTIQETLSTLKTKPVFSVVMPTYNTDEPFLRLCLDSVIKQSYPHWELCIADDCSPKPHVVKVLDEYAAQDKRIKIVKRKQNGHISKATNSAIEVATGDFIVLLDHDDELAEHALYFMAEAINQHPQAKIFYSDEDKIDTENNRSNPHFKSDWNPDLFFSQNYVSHLGVYKADIIKKIGGFRTGVEGSQDQDLLLRCLPHVKHSEIHHIPRVLYHWRMIEGSTAMASGEKSYTTEAGIKALQDYFKVNGPTGVTVEQGMLANTYKVNWPLPKPEPLVSLLIPTRDRKHITQVAVDSILKKTTYQHYEIIILDNSSVEQETLDWFKVIQQQDERVKVLRYDHPFNYSAINNFGAKHAQGSIIGLINNDIEVIRPDWLSEMVSLSIREDIGCVGAKLYYGNDLIQHGGVILGIGGVANHSHKMFKREHPGYFGRLVCRQNLSAVTAAVLLVRKEIYEQVSGLDEVNLHVAFNDVDFCLKVREAGYRNIWTPYAELYHHESISRGHEDTPEKQARFKKEVDFMKNKWSDNLKDDPFYNQNLTKAREDFSIGSQ